MAYVVLHSQATAQLTVTRNEMASLRSQRAQAERRIQGLQSELKALHRQLNARQSAEAGAQTDDQVIFPIKLPNAQVSSSRNARLVELSRVVHMPLV